MKPANRLGDFSLSMMSKERRFDVVNRSDLLVLRSIVGSAVDSNESHQELTELLAEALGYYPHPHFKGENREDNRPTPRFPRAPFVQQHSGEMEISNSGIPNDISFWYVKSWVPKEDGHNEDSNSSDSFWQGLGLGESLVLERCKVPEFRTIQATGTINSQIDRLLSNRHRRSIDLDAAAKLVAQGKIVRHWPRLARYRLTHDVTIVLDYSEHLEPIVGDAIRWKDRLVKRMGKQSCQIIASTPDRVLKQISALPKINQQIVIFSDLGTLSNLPNEKLRETWLCSLARKPFSNRPVHIISPTSMDSVSGELPGNFSISELSGLENRKRVGALMAALAFCRSVGCERLRHLRQGLAGSTLADELSVWNHEDAFLSGGLWSIRPGLVETYQERFLRLDVSLQKQLGRSIAKWQESLAPEERGLERIGLYEKRIGQAPPLALFKAVIEPATGTDEVTDAEAFLFNSMGQFATAYRTRKEQPDLAPVFGKVEEVRQKYQPVFESGVDNPPVSDPFLDTKAQGVVMIQQGLSLTMSDASNLPLNSFVGEVLRISGHLTETKTGRLIKYGDRWLSGKLALENEYQSLELDVLSKPQWAERIWRDREGLFAAHASGSVYQLLEANCDRRAAVWQNVMNPWGWATETGIDDSGLWAGFETGAARQVMRWISPGTFLMGSPESEPGRHDGEILHNVTLTTGFWLAETACSQELWEAVMKENPGHFQRGGDYPIEGVSWTDCQKFTKRLGQFLPDLEVTLPTEAQWEYACRAGSDTAFYWGGELSPDQANYDYQSSNDDRVRPQRSDGTQPVHSFQPNPWGLYQMHGNVWEWCQDRLGAYSPEPVIDPVGPVSGQQRVLRGGSWFSDGRSLRSAYRAPAPDFRSNFFGFRLAGGSALPVRASSADRPVRSTEEIEGKRK